LHPEEEHLLLADSEPDAMLWALWAGKEAAYKTIQKDQWNVTSKPLLYKVQFGRTEARIEERESAVALLPGERRLLGTVATPRGPDYRELRTQHRHLFCFGFRHKDCLAGGTDAL
jgi:hypothetical protein